VLPLCVCLSLSVCVCLCMMFVSLSQCVFAESCKQTLCKEETFRDLAQHLEQKMPLTEKRVAVYMLSVLVANNSKIHYKTYIQ